MSLIAELNKVKLANEFERKKIYELELNKSYEITFAKVMKTKFGNSVLLGLDGKVSTFLPKKYSELIKPKAIDKLIGLQMTVQNVIEEDGKHNVLIEFGERN